MSVTDLGVPAPTARPNLNCGQLRAWLWFSGGVRRWASPQCVVKHHDHGGEPRAADNERGNILQQLE
jgi:hypothetical protein